MNKYRSILAGVLSFSLLRIALSSKGKKSAKKIEKLNEKDFVNFKTRTAEELIKDRSSAYEYLA